jgi:hypothetical protein
MARMLVMIHDARRARRLRSVRAKATLAAP